MPAEDVVGSTLQKWTAGKKGKAAMIAVFEKIRDIPYGVPVDNNARAFYQGLNAYFQGIRDGQR